jgi:hypothetical protein
MRFILLCCLCIPAAALTAEPAAPAVEVPTPDGTRAYFTSEAYPNRVVRSVIGDDGTRGAPELVNLPSADGRPGAFLALPDGRMLHAGRDNLLKPREMGLRSSYDGGRTWPERRVLLEDAGPALELRQAGHGAYEVLLEDGPGTRSVPFTETWALDPWRLEQRPPLANVVGPLSIPDHRSRLEPQIPLPVDDTPFIEHVRAAASAADWPAPAAQPPAQAPGVSEPVSTAIVTQGILQWIGTRDGVYFREGSGAFMRHPTYGVDGPPSNVIAAVAVDSKDTLWVATPAGLSARDTDGAWRTIRGREGLPWEDLTAIAIDANDNIWLGSTRGLILHTPYTQGRQWYYRAGERYLPGDQIAEVAVAADGRSVFVKTDQGLGRIDLVERTLHSKADYWQQRFEERHRRLGMPSPALYDDAYAMTSWTHGPQPSDGLWTGYHVAAMSMAYSLTGDDQYRAAAKTGMEALYLLQNVTGVTGLVARSVIAVDEPYAEQAAKQDNWHTTADGKYMWRDDVSTDQIDGHYLAFYAYFEHVAQYDEQERARLEKQLRQVTDYILDNNYEIIDWHGERTLWGWYDPERTNNQPIHYLEGALYSLMLLSHIKVAHCITGDEKYLDHFRTLIHEHGYLSNLLLEKKLFPDELNHSDDQLSAVAYYPFLQLEHDPVIRETLHRACRRHARIELPERNTFFAFTYATIDPDDADVAGGVQTLRELPQDRRQWAMINSHRADVTIRPDANRGGQKVLLEVLPYDEHHFERWNQDPYRPDTGGDGRLDGSGEHHILVYWMGRYHGLIAPPQSR